MNVVFVELDRCMACLSCVHACQFKQADRNHVWRPTIFVNVDIARRRIYAGTCLQCETAECIEVCPVNALARDPGTAAVIVDQETCLGCGLCVAACPFGHMQIDESLRKAAKCDLCGGNPTCVLMCMARALHFGSIDSLAERKRKQTDIRLGLRAVPDDEAEGQ